MDAEQIRDAMLSAAGALDPKMGGPSAELTAGFKRRTVYGKVSRYRLDEYLQLFDFPNPSFSAEKRHSTSVPLQRLFFMNSEFVQQQAEVLARSTEAEKDRGARIGKLYRSIFGRAPSDAEIQAGVEYLKAEPMRSYEERKAAPQKKEPPEETDEEKDKPKDKPEEKMLPVTPWGRYVKVLLSSPEFLFVD